LERWEGNILIVYADKLANNIPTYCAGRTDWRAPVGAKLTSDQCAAVNKATLLEYGYAVLACTQWQYLTPTRLVSLTIFAINVGAPGACGSQAVRLINAGQIAAGCRAIAYTPSGLANPAGVSFRCAVGNGLGAPGSNTGGIRAHIDELVIIKGWAGDVSGMTSEIVL